jgi:hypothetical protein
MERAAGAFVEGANGAIVAAILVAVGEISFASE